MKTTLEVHWFVRGMPPAVVQRWFRIECPGKLLEEEPETREDLYAYKRSDRLGQQHHTIPSLGDRQSGADFVTPKKSSRIPQEFAWLQNFTLHRFKALSYLDNYEEVNLKRRQGNLELKLRQQELEVEQFGEVNHRAIWEGKIERWCKLSEEELRASDINVSASGSTPEIDWISVYKCRQQKLYRGVASELTRLRINNESWWSVAFEMTQNHQDPQGKVFKNVVKQAAQNYCGPKLSLNDSYSYSSWQAQVVS